MLKRISTMPWPKLSDIARTAFPSAFGDNKKVPRQWMRPNDDAFVLSRTCWSMCALVEATSRLRGRPARVLLPEYFCDQTLWPLRHTPAKIEFYPIDSEMQPAFEQIGAGPETVDLFFLVHYFGNAIDASRARTFCDQIGAYLVEDATHAIGPIDGIGEMGDIVLYSPWKFFPIPNAGLMMVRPRAAPLRDTISIAVSGLGDSTAHGFNWIRQSLERSLNSLLPGTPALRGEFADVTATVPLVMRPVPSPLAMRWLSTVNIEKIAKRRMANDRAVRKFFSSFPSCRPLFKNQASAPWRSTILFASPATAANVYAILRECGIEAEAWPPELPSEVSNKFGNAFSIRSTLALLIHPEEGYERRMWRKSAN
jgi:hypothetical protein